MQKRDIIEAFDFENKKSPIDNIYDLIGDGFLQKAGDRFYIPTRKLMELAFLPESGIILLDDNMRRYLSYNNSYYRGDLIHALGNETIVDVMITLGYFRLEGDRRYRKSPDFEQALSDGIDIVKLR
jgi:hypothetical protein